MAGRIRTIKPEWLEDERLSGASAHARVLSVGLILLADDHGNGRAHTQFLHSQIFPADDGVNIAAVVAELSGWFVDIYQASGQTYFHIKNWEKHQKVQHPGRPRVPPPPANLASQPKTKSKVAYFIRGMSTGLIKIGASADPIQRIVELSKCSPESLALLAVGGSERSLHSELASSRVHGEWFTASDEVLTKIREMGGDPEKPMFVASYEGMRRVMTSHEVLTNPHEDLSEPHEVLTPDHRSPITDQRPTINDQKISDKPTEPPAVAGPGPVGPDTSEARKVFDAYVECWREHVGRGATPVLTDKRRKAIRARIAEHGAKAVECAVRGIWASDWHRENGQTSLDLAMRDAAHVERFALLVAPPAQRAPWVEPEPPPFTFARPVDGPPVEPVGDLAALLKLASGL